MDQLSALWKQALVKYLTLYNRSGSVRKICIIYRNYRLGLITAVDLTRLSNHCHCFLIGRIESFQSCLVTAGFGQRQSLKPTTYILTTSESEI